VVSVHTTAINLNERQTCSCNSSDRTTSYYELFETRVSKRSTLPDCVDVDIQEFYDTTLLDESKSVQQKTTETLQIVAKWEQTLTIAGSVPPQTTLQTEVTMHALLYATTSHSQLLLVVSLVYTVLNYRPTYYRVPLELHLTTSELWFGQEQEGILP